MEESREDEESAQLLLDALREEDNIIPWHLRQQYLESEIPLLGVGPVEKKGNLPKGWQIEHWTRFMYSAVGTTNNKAHPGKPLDAAETIKTTILGDDFRMFRTGFYQKDEGSDTTDETIINISKQLYGLMPLISRTNIRQYYSALMGNLEEAVALVARTILLSHPDIIKVLPILFGNNNWEVMDELGRTYRAPGSTRPFNSPVFPNYGYIIKTTDGSCRICPTAFYLNGSELGSVYSGVRNGMNMAADYMTQWDGSTMDEYARHEGSGQNKVYHTVGRALQRKFTGSPLINITDIMFLWPYGFDRITNGNIKLQFIPRRYATEWWLKPSLNLGDRILPLSQSIFRRRRLVRTGQSTHLTEFGYERYTSLRTLMDRFLQLAPLATFPEEPDIPFTRLKLDSFTISAQQQSVPTYPLTYINGNRTCSGFFECSVPMKDGQQLCNQHEKGLQQALMTSQQNHQTSILARELILSISSSTWHLRQSVTLQGQKKLLDVINFIDDWLSDPQRSIWFVDVEGCIGPRKFVAGVPFDITVIALSGTNPLIETTVQYKEPVSDIVSYINKDISSWQGIHRCIKRVYRNRHETYGLAPSKISDILRQEGFDPAKHAVAAWTTKHSGGDFGCLKRLLLGLDEIVIGSESLNTDYTDFHTIPLIHPIYNSTELLYMDLQSAYSVMFGSGEASRISWHTSKADTLAAKNMFIEWRRHFPQLKQQLQRGFAV